LTSALVSALLGVARSVGNHNVQPSTTINHNKQQQQAQVAKPWGRQSHPITLGIEISRNRQKGTLRLSQKTYFEGVLKRYGLEGLNGTNTPIREGLKFYIDDADYVNDDDKNLYH